MPRPEFRPSSTAQDNFYESSVKWIKSLKDRHDPYGYIDILENDPNSNSQAIDNVIIPAYTPSQQEIDAVGSSEAIQEYILNAVEADSDEIMGPGNFDKFIDELVASQSLETISQRLAQPNQNCATVAFHANIMALPIYAAAVPKALDRIAKDSGEEFDMFEFSRQNLLPINPALTVASFKGQPVVERLSKFATLFKIPPPSRSTLSYGFDRELLKFMASQSKNASGDYIKALYDQGKSAYLTIDPTTATFESTMKNGKLSALRRNPVNRGAQAMILKDFNYVWPMTMMLNGRGSSWYIGKSLELDHDGSFSEVIMDLDRQTEELAGVKMSVAYPDRVIGKLAIGANSGLTAT